MKIRMDNKNDEVTFNDNDLSFNNIKMISLFIG